MAVEDLKRVLDTYGVEKIARKFVDVEPALSHYEDFERVLTSLVDLFGDCSGCFTGDGDPSCPIRECCVQRASACVECVELDTCERLRTAVLYQQCIVRTIRAKKNRSRQ